MSFDNGMSVYNYYKDFCTCHKNPLKRKINPLISEFTDDVVYASYAACPINAIAAMLGRHGHTMLTFDYSTISDF